MLEEQAPKFEQFRSTVEKGRAAGDEPQFLVRLVSGPATVQNRGITRLSLRRDTAQPDRWHLLAQIKNYSNEKADVVLAFSINGQSIGQRKNAFPGKRPTPEDEFTWDQGGMLQAEISPSDALQADDRAIVNLPTFRTVRVAVFASDASPFAADLLSVLSSNPYVQAQDWCPGELSANIARTWRFYQGREFARAAGLQFDLVSQRAAGCRVSPAARHGMELAASGDAVGPHARHQRAQSRGA